MPEPTLKVSVTCPDCALESVSEMPIAVIANGLLTGQSLRLYSHCHDRYWTATFTEREQLRSTLAAYSPAVEPFGHPSPRSTRRPRDATPVRLPDSLADAL
jgi:hypothetical protein